MTPATANTGEASVASQLSMSIEDAGKGIPTGVRIEKQPDADIYTVLGKIGEVGTLTATIMPVEGAENQWELLGKMVFSQDKYAAGNVDAMVMPDISIDSEGGKIQSTLVMFSLPITLPPASVATSPANLEFPVSARFTAPRPVQFTFSFSAS